MCICLPRVDWSHYPPWNCHIAPENWWLEVGRWYFLLRLLIFKDMSVSGRVISPHYICCRFLGYADGPLFVRVSMAMDAIIADLVENLKEIVWGSVHDRSCHIPQDPRTVISPTFGTNVWGVVQILQVEKRSAAWGMFIVDPCGIRYPILEYLRILP